MKITIAPLFARIPAFFRGSNSLIFTLVVFVAIFVLSYYYLSKIDRIEQKEIVISVDGETAAGKKEIRSLNIGLGINARQLVEIGGEYGYLSIDVVPPYDGKNG